MVVYSRKRQSGRKTVPQNGRLMVDRRKKIVIQKMVVRYMKYGGSKKWLFGMKWWFKNGSKNGRSKKKNGEMVVPKNGRSVYEIWWFKKNGCSV